MHRNLIGRSILLKELKEMLKLNEHFYLPLSNFILLEIM
jgi:hypothetical protein